MNPTDPIASGFVVTATVSSFLLALSPLPVMYQIIQTREIGVYRPDPYIFGIIFGIVNGVYSIYANHVVSFISCMICLSLFITYMIIFIWFSKNRTKIFYRLCVFLSLAICIDGIAPVIWFIMKGDGLFVRTWLGVCACFAVTLLYTGQLTNIVHVIKHRDARSISVSLMLGGLFAAVMWTIYAVLVLDPYFLTANALGVVAGITQAVLLTIYPKPVSSDKDCLEDPEN